MHRGVCARADVAVVVHGRVNESGFPKTVLAGIFHHNLVRGDTSFRPGRQSNVVAGDFSVHPAGDFSVLVRALGQVAQDALPDVETEAWIGRDSRVFSMAREHQVPCSPVNRPVTRNFVIGKRVPTYKNFG